MRRRTCYDRGMKLTFSCPRCEAPGQFDLAAGTEQLACPSCHAGLPGAGTDLSGEGISECLVCGDRELFVRKDFPQRIGVTIVVVGCLASSIAWGCYQIEVAFGILFATALIDVVLYLLVGDALECYRCGALYRGIEDTADREGFNLETHERFRQVQARLDESRVDESKASVAVEETKPNHSVSMGH